MSEQPPFPQPPERDEPDPQWPAPAPTARPGDYQPPPGAYPPPPGAYPPPGTYAASYSAPPQSAYFPPGVEPASWGVRLAAMLIDGVISNVLALILAVGTGFAVYGSTTGSDAESAAWVTGVLVYLGVALVWFLLYDPLTMRRQGARNGQTWGKQWLGIRVVREDGQPVTAGTAFVRDVVMQGFVFGFLGGFFFSAPTLLDGLWPLWDQRNQSLHDKVANTLVVRT